jgi:hypothetical protein
MGKPIFETSTATSFSHCNLYPETVYTYTLIIRNADGYQARVTETFETGAATTIGTVTVLSPVFPYMRDVQIPINLSCDTPASRSLYAELFDNQGNQVQANSFECCTLSLQGLNPGFNYSASIGFSDEGQMNVTFALPWEEQPTPKMSLRYVTSSAFVLDIIPSALTGSFEWTAVSVELIAKRVSTGVTVFQTMLSCWINGAEQYCPSSNSITGLEATFDDYTYVVSARTWGDLGSSAWVDATFEADIGQKGTIGFQKSVYLYEDDAYVWLQVDRLYGTKTADTVTFEVFGIVSWSCQFISDFTSCVIDLTGDNTGTSIP